MWRAPVIVTAPAAEPLSLADAKAPEAIRACASLSGWNWLRSVE